MKLREQIRRSIDGLDNQSLTLLYEQIQMIQQTKHGQDGPSAAPSIQDVLELTSSSRGPWSDDVIAERRERL